jgi:zinc protease
MMRLHKETLENGLTVVVQEMHSVGVVALQAWVGVGSADESAREAGLAHLHEHMLFKGTARRKVGEIAQAVEAAGGEINAWTSVDQTVYHVVLASQFFDVGIDVLADAIQHSAFDPDELSREKEVVLEEIKRGEDQPGRVASQELFRLAFTTHPYRNPVIGTPETVSSFTRDDVVSFYRRWYVPENVTVIIVGDVPVVRAVERVRHAFAGFSATSLPARHGLREPDQPAPRALVRRLPFEETYFSAALPVPAVDHSDVPALDVLAAILGQGESSRLTQEVKRRRSLATDVYSYCYTPRDPGLWVVGGSAAPRRAREALRLCLAETFRLAHEEVAEEELAKARAQIESQAIYDKETAQGMARKLGFYESALHDLAFEQRYYQAIARLGPGDLLEVATRYLRPDRLSIVAVEPGKTRSPLRDEDFLGFAEDFARPRRRSRPPRETERVVRAVLPGGPTLLVLRDARVPLVALRAVWRGGLRYERAQNNGITNFIAELITQGTERRTAEEVAHAVDAMAGHVSGFMGRNSFGIRAELLAKHFDRGLELFAECLTSPGFGAEEAERQRSLLLDEIRALDDHPSGLSFRLLAQGLYPRHPYRLHSLGTKQVVSRLDRSDLGRFYRQHYPLSRMVLAVVGDVEPARVVDRVARVLGSGTRPRAEPQEPRPDPPLRAPVVKEETREKRQAHIALGFRGTTFHSQDRYSLEVLSTILSGQSGRLFLELRDRRSLAYSVSSFSVEGLEPGYFAVYIGTSPEKIREAVEGILRELGKVRETRVSAAELRRAQRYLIGTHAISLQRLSARAATVGFDECYGLGHDYSERYGELISEVTRESVLEAARRYLDPQRFALAVVRPAEAEGVASLSLSAAPER